MDKRTFVCKVCGSSDIRWTGDYVWDTVNGEFSARKNGMHPTVLPRCGNCDLRDSAIEVDLKEEE